MPVPLHTVSSEEKRRLRRESQHIARLLVNVDDIEQGGARMLAEYRRTFAKSDDGYLKYGLAVMFLCDLLRHCCCHQSRRVSYLIDEHLAACGSINTQRVLRQNELAMYRRFKDADGEAKCVRILKALNERT